VLLTVPAGGLAAACEEGAIDGRSGSVFGWAGGAEAGREDSFEAVRVGIEAGAAAVRVADSVADGAGAASAGAGAVCAWALG
jgi:hypothetical protein